MSDDLGGPRFEKPIERRDFFGLAAAFSFFGTLFAATIGMIRLPMPSVFPETDSRFPIGKPGDFPKGGQIHIPRRRLWVISEETGVAAVSTVCPHLGCVVSREKSGDYICPCHGSKFTAAGKVTGGPSPRGLIWLEVSLAPDGRLMVDRDREVKSETRLQI